MDHVKRLRLICGILAALCFALATVTLLELLLATFNPLWMATNILCNEAGCRWVVDGLDLLGPVRASEARNIPGIDEAVIKQISDPAAKTLLVGSVITRTIPMVALYAALGFTMLRFRDIERFNIKAIMWLRRAAVAAGVMVLAKPIAESLQATAISPALSEGDSWRFSITGSDLPFDLFLAGVLWVATWALTEGRRVNEELAEYI